VTVKLNVTMFFDAGKTIIWNDQLFAVYLTMPLTPHICTRRIIGRLVKRESENL
jgi:hypothetical protein